MFVYVLQQGEDGPVKIGVGENPHNRMIGAQCYNPNPLFLRGVCRGGRGAERALHETFRAHHIRGEWFSPSPDVMAFVRQLPSWESVKAGGECPTLRTPAERASLLRDAGYTHQEIGDYMGISRQRAQQLASIPNGANHGKKAFMRRNSRIEDGPNWLGDERPPIGDYVAANPDMFKTTLLIDGDL